jgi:hypothetical protein
MYTALDDDLKVTPIFIIVDYLEANNYCSADDWKESTPMIGEGEPEKKAYKILNKIAKICLFHSKVAMVNQMGRLQLDEEEQLKLLRIIPKLQSLSCW